MGVCSRVCIFTAASQSWADPNLATVFATTHGAYDVLADRLCVLLGMRPRGFHCV